MADPTSHIMMNLPFFSISPPKIFIPARGTAFPKLEGDFLEVSQLEPGHLLRAEMSTRSHTSSGAWLTEIRVAGPNLSLAAEL